MYEIKEVLPLSKKPFITNTDFIAFLQLVYIISFPASQPGAREPCLQFLNLLILDEFLDLIFLKFGTYNTNSSGILGTAVADIYFTGNIVKIDPSAVIGRKHTFRAEYKTVLGFILKCLQERVYLILGIMSACLKSYACKHFIGMVMMVIVVMASAGTLFAMMMVIGDRGLGIGRKLITDY